MTAPTSASSQSDRVVLTLREKLLRGEFPAGERLTELGLVARLGASRTPVRQALAQLAYEGLLEPVPAGGFRVRRFTLAEVWDAIELRGVLEGTAARLAAERLVDETELDDLRRHLAAMDPLMPVGPGNIVPYLQVNDAFHQALWVLAKNRLLLATIASVLRLPFAAPGALVFGEAESAVAARTAEIAQEHHRAIVEAISSGAGTRAEHLAREHAHIARRVLERALQDKTLFDRVPGASLIALSVAV
jgi:GntR family transcriptional regulator of vanillate catabolism